MKKRILTLLLALIFILSLFAACSQPAEDSGDNSGDDSAENSGDDSAENSGDDSAEGDGEEKIFYLTMGGNSTGIAQEGRMYNIWQDGMGLASILQFRALLLLDENNEVKDVDMAESYEVSEDGLTYTFTLKDLKWSDGSEVTAQDVKWSIEAAIVALRTNSNYTTAFSYIVGHDEYKAAYEADPSVVGTSLEGVAIDGKTITITLSEPYSLFAQVMGTFAILPQAYFVECDLGEIYSYYDYWDHAVVCGMYMVQEVVEKDYALLVPNPYYEGTPGNFDQVIINYSTDDTLALQNGSADLVADNAPGLYDIAKGLDNYSIYYADIVYARQFMYMVTGNDGKVNDKTQDVRVRQAVAYAVDWATVLQGIYGDLAIPTTTALSSSSPYYAGEMFNYDPEKAQELLNEAGWTPGDTMRCMYYYNDQATQDLVDTMASYMAAVGVTLEGIYTSNSAEDLYVVREYEIMYGGHSAFSPAIRFTSLITESCETIYPASATFGDLVANLLGATDEETLANAYKELQQTEWDTCYRFTAYYMPFEFYVSDRISIPDDMAWGNNWNLWDMRFDEWDIAA